jgi:hypothetical protein
MFETVPKLRDECQALRGRQTNDLIRSEQFHASSLRERGRGGKASERPSGESGQPRLVSVALQRSLRHLRLVAPDFDIILLTPGPRQIVGRLHSQPVVRVRPSSLFQPDCHFRRYPGSAVDDAGQGVAGYAQDFGPFGHARPKGSRQASLVERPGCGGFFMGMLSFLSSGSPSNQRRTRPRRQSGKQSASCNFKSGARCW